MTTNSARKGSTTRARTATSSKSKSKVKKSPKSLLSSILYADQGRTFFKYMLSNSEDHALLALIENQPGKTVPEYVNQQMKNTNTLAADQKERGRLTRLMNLLLRETREGYLLASLGQVALPYLGRKPRWFLQLSKEDQAKVPTHNPPVQVVTLNFQLPSESCEGVNYSFASLRRSYLGIARFGKSAWFSPQRMDALVEADKELTKQIENANVQIGLIADYRSQIDDAEERVKTATGASEQLLAQIEVMKADTLHSNALAMQNAHLQAAALAENTAMLGQLLNKMQTTENNGGVYN